MSLKIYSWNLNGIRAAAKAGFFNWLENSQADIILLQEVRALPEQLNPEQIEPFGYKSIWHPAEKKGYSGVAIYTKLPFSHSDIQVGLGDPEFDNEGRFLGFFHNNIFYASAYFPNSQPEGKRLAYKLAFCRKLQIKLTELRKSNISIVLGGDINIAHKEIDLANPKQNQKNPGFLPEERQWYSEFLADGYLDAFRLFEKNGGHYTWWSNRKGVREKNIGWRIDSHFVSEDLINNISKAGIHSDVYGSDHCPISLDLSFP
ncbi:exodeoxyribonuclease III [Fluviispira vulneris]|uniref:exodeoxyribonuclease III n=1 Tax=Fluviispira vulneris TaxID=2763012 RepID=UPI001643FFD7|nr:exodeoxyribonuclease III [Fluviispira vulneris]